MEGNAILYTRVSTDDQADRGYSLEVQKLTLTKYCELKGLKIVKHFQEDFSAKNFERPERKKLVEYVSINRKMIDHIFFTRWDRFSRNETEAKAVLRRFRDMGINVNSTEQPIDLSNPDNKMMLSFYLTLPEIENDKNSIRTIEGSQQARIQGCWTGSAPIGYKNFRLDDGKASLIITEKAKIVVEAFEQVAKGVSSIDSIRVSFIPKGLKLSKQGFHNMLRNVVYIGKIFVKGWMKESAKIVDGLHDGIISEELFNDVQFILKGKQKINKQHSKTNDIFPLRGFLSCPQCDRVLTGGFSTGRSKKKYPYYKCQNNCAGSNYSALTVNNEFENYLNTLVFSCEAKDLFSLIIQDIIKERKGDKGIQLKKIGEEIEKYKSLLINVEDDFFSRKIDKNMHASAFSRYEAKIQELKIMANEITGFDKDLDKECRKAIGILSNLSGFYQTSQVEVKQAIIGSIFSENLVFCNNKYRTNRINKILSIILLIDNDLAQEENKKPGNFAGLSSMAPAAGLEPATL